jgi:hypothetical protein
MGRISRTIGLAKASWKVLRRDRELLALPVLSFLVSVGSLAVLWVPIVAVADLSGLSSEEGQINPVLALAGIASALILSIVGVFFKAALVAGAYERLTGGDPTIRSALNRAVGRLSGLLPWALLSATVGLILSALKDRAGRLGRFAVDLIGMAWEAASFLVIPAIVIDNHRAISGLKASASLLKKTWGENLASQIGFGLLGLAFTIPGVLLVMVAGPIALVIAVPWVAMVVVVLTALGAIFQTALYLYATTGSMPEDFEDSNLREAFAVRA